ncbi:MAG: hypothetical protein FJ280_08010 [Planctomycetes bacterium]|nr:hypothetical protein [Planctomycetota bacterium]
MGLIGRLGEWSMRGAEVKGLRVADVNIAGSGACVAGLVGLSDGTVAQCYSTGAVRGAWYVGGLVGCHHDGIVTDCYSAGTVSSTGGGVGGLVGENQGFVTYCWSASAVGGIEQDGEVGGLVGYNRGTVTNCCSTSAVRGTGQWWGAVGGLVGYNDCVDGDGVITHCYSVGLVSATENVGGLVGSSPCDDCDAFVTSSFWDIQTSGQTSSAGGTGRTTAEMKDPNTFRAAAWDFVGEIQNGTHEVWRMPEGGGYPVLAILHGYTPPQLQGKGTSGDPYLISDAMELGAMVHCSPHAHYRLAASIDLSGIRWATAVIPLLFYGSFDGDGYTISHLTINGERPLGLFELLGPEAEVRNLGVVDVNIVGSSIVGGLAGYNGGAVAQCYSTGAVSGSGSVGGLVGFSTRSLAQCYSSTAVSGDGAVGGLVGANTGSVTQCYSTGAVSGTRGSIGGLIGYNNGGTVTQCYSTGVVSGGFGLVGLREGSEVTACFWDTQTSGQTTSAGGIGKMTAEMQTAKTFLDAGWDFMGEAVNGTEDIWWILEGKDYPRLWWEAANK